MITVREMVRISTLGPCRWYVSIRGGKNEKTYIYYFTYDSYLRIRDHPQDYSLKGHDLSWCIRVPNPPMDMSWNAGDSAGRGSKSMEYLPTDNTLIVMLANSGLYKYLMKVNIPALNLLSKSTTFSSLYQTTFTTTPSSPVNIAINPCTGASIQTLPYYIFLGDIHYMPAETQTTPKLYFTLYGSYINSCSVYLTANGFLGWSEVDFSNIQGMWALSTPCYPDANCCGSTGKYLFDDPNPGRIHILAGSR